MVGLASHSHPGLALGTSWAQVSFLTGHILLGVALLALVLVATRKRRSHAQAPGRRRGRPG